MAKTPKMAKPYAKTFAKTDAKTSDDISGATAPLAFAGIGSALAAGLGVAAAGLSLHSYAPSPARSAARSSACGSTAAEAISC